MLPRAEQAYLTLRRNIIGGVYLPGSRLSARRVVEQTGLGTTPVREAFVRLQHERLLQALPRSGYVVAELTRKSVVDFHEIWRLIGPAVVRLGVENRTPAQFRRLEEIAHDVIALLPRLGDGFALNEWLALAQERFTILACASDNPHLIAMNDRLSSENERIYSYHLRSSANREGFRFFGLDSKSVLGSLQLVRERRGAEAEAATRAAIDRTHESMLALFWQDGDAAPGGA